MAEAERPLARDLGARHARLTELLRHRLDHRLQVLARGWIRLDGEGTKNVTVELQANDVVVPAGHQLGLVISGNRSGVTAIDTSAQTYSVNLATSRLNLPIDGPMASFAPGQIKPEKTVDLREGTLPLLDEFIVPQP